MRVRPGLLVVVASTVWLVQSSAAAGQSPVIEFQPTPQPAILGGEAVFGVIASGDAPLSYQWRKFGALPCCRTGAC